MAATEKEQKMTDYPNGPMYPDVVVQLTGEDGNAFAIIGAVSRALKADGKREAAAAWSEQAMNSESYDALLQLAMRTVTVA